MLIETYAILAKNDTVDPDFPADPVADLLDDVNGPVTREGECDLYDTEFIFEMCDVSAINKALEAGYTSVSLYGDRWTVKIAWEEAKKLFIDSRKELQNA